MGKYFDLKELCHSDTANACGIDNTPTEKAKENLQALINNVLDPLREWYGKPIYINSGYRCPELNKTVGGVPNSFHLTGCAADIDIGNKTENKILFDYIKEKLPFTELGFEGNGRWIHVAYVEGRENEKEVFYA